MSCKFIALTPKQNKIKKKKNKDSQYQISNVLIFDSAF